MSEGEVAARFCRVVCIGAGGLMSHVAPTLVRKGIGALVLLDDDVVEVRNLNRQRFYSKDLGRNMALALAENLQAECIISTEISGHALRMEDAIERGIDLSCKVSVRLAFPASLLYFNQC